MARRYDAGMEDEPVRENKLLSPPPPKHGPVAGIVIVLLIMLIGGLFFGLDRLQKERDARNQAPFIPNSTTTITIIKTSTTTIYQYSTTTGD